MKPNCPNKKCTLGLSPGLETSSIVRNGSYFRKSDSRHIDRFHCLGCGKYFSRATFSPCYWQKKRRINQPLNLLLCSGVSQRRAAKILKVDRKTVVRAFRFLAAQARIKQNRWIKDYENHPLASIQFDDLETSEHSKCKPLSVALAVDPIHRKIMGFQVSEMPAKGMLSKKAIKKYGHRPDKRSTGWNQLMKNLKPYVEVNATFTSDENPHYPKYVYKHHPTVKHIQVPGGRGANTGQGELKQLKFDPLFSLNHTCAMLRANMNRLFRKTWCTTKTKQGLMDHLALYVVYHNQELTPDPQS